MYLICGNFVVLVLTFADGKPVPVRAWVEVYGQLVGSVLSIWELSQLQTSPNAVPTPTYINVSDASFKIMDSIAPGHPSAAPINNVLALSTTFKNRFLLQFSTRQILLHWSSGLRLALFEYVSLNEAYTGALLAGKGSKLHGIRQVLQETKFKHQEQVVVRFGAGMPWTKCWAVVTPPGYKKRKANKTGHIKFYESMKAKQKKQDPIAVISGAVAAYAVYPESKLLIEQSTLFKIAGKITVDESGSRNGFIFIMPDIHHGVFGFETLIRFLIPTFDVFELYGRPARFNADKADIRSLMFGLPDYPNTRYLDLADVYDISLAHPFDDWSDETWRGVLKDAIVQKMVAGTRNSHRLLPSEPAHNTPPIPQETFQAQNEIKPERVNPATVRFT